MILQQRPDQLAAVRFRARLQLRVLKPARLLARRAPACPPASPQRQELLRSIGERLQRWPPCKERRCSILGGRAQAPGAIAVYGPPLLGDANVEGTVDSNTNPCSCVLSSATTAFRKLRTSCDAPRRPCAQVAEPGGLTLPRRPDLYLNLDPVNGHRVLPTTSSGPTG